MRASPLLLTLAVVAAGWAGCLADDRRSLTLVDNGVPVDTTRDQGQVWVVWVHGNETRSHLAGPERGQAVCSIVWDHDLDRSARSLAYDAERHPFRPDRVATVVVFDHWEVGSSCPIAYDVVPDPSGPVSGSLGHGGELVLQVHENGSLTVQGQLVPLGKAAHLQYSQEDREGATTFRYAGTLLVETLGAWPAANLEPVE